MRMGRFFLTGAMALMLGGCFGGAKVPATLLSLDSSAPPLAQPQRSSAAGQAVTIDYPLIPKELATTRVPAEAGGTAVSYIKDLMWVETPDKLFQRLVQETVLRTTRRVVLDPRQSSLDPGLRLTGSLSKFGYDAGAGAVVVRYDGALSTGGGSRVETRRFEARVPADGTARSVGPALNQAANQVATEVAAWIGG
ncbi:ABC-type transport auxiliary lipoprotein family protein [Sphingomonas sp. ASV193]|uniref:ABC-type transport auxiliary lipoprotein family protein n=1 Tax=Sphingomonas sp. ASV193 TaxID=3144405 RepID=UPI0032E88592